MRSPQRFIRPEGPGRVEPLAALCGQCVAAARPVRCLSQRGRPAGGRGGVEAGRSGREGPRPVRGRAREGAGPSAWRFGNRHGSRPSPAGRVPSKARAQNFARKENT
jgi:hypothetical protein